MKPDSRIIVFLLISILLITAPHVNNIPFPLFSFFCLLWGWRFIAVWKPAWQPKKVSIFLLTLVGLVLLYTQHQGIFGRDGGTALFVTALGLKLLEIKTHRDVYLTNYLAFVVASTLFLFEKSILMSIYILFVCCALLATLVTINSHRRHAPTAVKTAALIVVQALPLALVLFILFPRVEAPRWMFVEEKDKARSGLSDTMEPGSISRLGMSDELVFRAKFEGKVPPPELRYWRGPVYSHTDGKVWSESPNRFFKRYLDKTRFDGPSLRYTLLMEPQRHHWVYALERVSEFEGPLDQNAYYQLITRNDPQKRAEYRLVSRPSYNTGYLTKTELHDNLQLPGEPSDRIVELVKSLDGFDSAPDNFIRNLLNYFRKQNFYYTLTPGTMGENPIETFLFENRFGFCSHYSTAFVYLMRVANVPARVVGGYQGGEYNEVGKFLEVRQAHAHAWAEVWLKNKGWVRIDPTSAVAPERTLQDINIEQQLASGEVSYAPIAINVRMSWLKRGRQMWNSMDYSWQRWIINYTNTGRNSLLSALGIDSIQRLLYGLLVSSAFVTLLLAWLLLRKQRAAVDPAVRYYRKFCAKLAKRRPEMQIRVGEGALNYAARAKRQYPQLAEQIDRITALFVKLRYRPDSGENDLLHLKQYVGQFKTPSREMDAG